MTSPQKLSELKALGRYLVIEPSMDEVTQVSDGGIVIPDQAQEDPQFGYIRSIGREASILLGLTTSAVGLKVLFSKYSGENIKQDDKKYKVIQVQDVMAILETVEVPVVQPQCS